MCRSWSEWRMRRIMCCVFHLLTCGYSMFKVEHLLEADHLSNVYWKTNTEKSVLQCYILNNT